MQLPDSFVQTVSSTFDGGAAWLAELPQLIAACAARWGLLVQPHFPALSYNYAAPAMLPDGTAVVLKLGVPCRDLTTEIEALKLYDGRAMCHLLDADAKRGFLLLERLQPGMMLTAVPNDETATRIAADVMRRLWRPLPESHIFPTVADWAAGLVDLRTEFDGGTGPFPTRLVQMAETLFADLLSSSTAAMLLHGDLHHYNILTAEREPWLAIDPKGLAGEPAYEVGAFIRNPLDLHEWPDREQVVARRLHIFAEELNMDRQRLVAWSLAQEVLSKWCDYEDLGALPDMWLAELLAGMSGEGVIW